MIDNLIYDIGMHNGDDTEYYLRRGYKVIAIDASPQLVAAATIRFKEAIENKSLKILNVGIANEEGRMDFYLNKKNSVWNSFDLNIVRRDGADFETIKIETKNILQILAENKLPYYMKIDIEGNDIVCLNSLINSTEKPKFISAEVNDFEILLKLKELGYKKFKLINQNCFLPLELPATKEYKIYRKKRAFLLSANLLIIILRRVFGKYINRYFEKRYKRNFTYYHAFGSSGPFGDDLPGTWFNFEEISKIYEKYKIIHQESKGNVGYNFWIDVHATI